MVAPRFAELAPSSCHSGWLPLGPKPAWCDLEATGISPEMSLILELWEKLNLGIGKMEIEVAQVAFMVWSLVIISSVKV